MKRQYTIENYTQEITIVLCAINEQILSLDDLNKSQSHRFIFYCNLHNCAAPGIYHYNVSGSEKKTLKCVVFKQADQADQASHSMNSIAFQNGHPARVLGFLSS